MLKWNEEFYITFTGSMGQKFSTPLGDGFICKIDAENEIKRLKEKSIFKAFNDSGLKIYETDSIDWLV